MNNTAVFIRLGEIRKHSNADRLQLTTVFGNQIVVGLSEKQGDVGIYFDSNLQLSEQFASANDLIRRKDRDGNQVGGMFDTNRKVRCQKFRGERSDGFYIPLDSLSYIGKVSVDGDSIKIGKYNYKVGDEFNDIDTFPICNKFIVTRSVSQKNNKKGPKKFKYDSIMFKEHIDTGHLSREIDKIGIDDPIVITAKLHGTSGRYAHVLVEQPLPKWKEILNKIWFNFKPELKWQDLHGTRRVVLQPEQGQTQFHDPALRELAIRPFKGNLRKGETIFFEIVGFEPNGKPIMPQVDTSKLKDKEFTKKYGKLMTYSYGCKPEPIITAIVTDAFPSDITSHKQFDVYVYRITLTNEDGQSYDYSWNDVKRRCKDLGVKHVPEIYRGSMVDYAYEHPDFAEGVEETEVRDEFVKAIDEYVSRPDLVDPSHILEGIVVRNERTNFAFEAYKHKSFEFKVLEDILAMDGIENQEDVQVSENNEG